MNQSNVTNTQFLPFVADNVDVMKEIAAWLSDDAGDLDPAKAAQLAQTLHPEDADAAEAFEKKLTGAWTQQAEALRHAAAQNVGV